MKFVVAKLGIEEFRRLVLEEREQLRHDPAWTAHLDNLDAYDETPLKPPTQLNGASKPEGFDEWHATNVRSQRQPGYAVVNITLPLGDITADQTRALADISRKYVKDTIRTTVEQNLVLRWVSLSDLPALYQELKAIGLGAAGAESTVDITACPGTDSCKLGISSSRGLAAYLRNYFIDTGVNEGIKDLRIKISGCPNSMRSTPHRKHRILWLITTYGETYRPILPSFVGRSRYRECKCLWTSRREDSRQEHPANHRALDRKIP